MSILLTFYFLFLLTYGGILGFAVYRVFLFAKNRDLKGYSRRITLSFVMIVLFFIFSSLIVIQRYDWNDSASNLLKQAGLNIGGSYKSSGAISPTLPVGTK